jgi:hypothetical protein
MAFFHTVFSSSLNTMLLASIVMVITANKDEIERKLEETEEAKKPATADFSLKLICSWVLHHRTARRGTGM